jgi:hypothetical protein
VVVEEEGQEETVTKGRGEEKTKRKEELTVDHEWYLPVAIFDVESDCFRRDKK